MVNRLIKILTIILSFFVFNSCKDYEYLNPVDTGVNNPAPTNVSINFSADTLAIIRWQHPSADKALFTVEISSDSITWTKLAETSGSLTLQSRYDFKADKIYSFRVKASFDKNESKYSPTVQQKITGLGAPGNLTVSFPTDTVGMITWQDNSLIETGYEIYTTDLDAKDSLIKTLPANSISTEVLGQYSTNREYKFYIKAVTKNNSIASVDTAKGKPTLKTPTGLQVTFPTDTAALLTWEDNLSFETGFDIYMYSDSANYGLVKTVPSNTIKTEIHGQFLLTQNYYFFIKAKTKYNVSESSITVKSKPIELTPPSNLGVSFPNDTLAVLTWEDKIIYETGFEIYISINGINYSYVKTVPANTTRTEIGGDYNTYSNYSFFIKAVSKNNKSLQSNIVQGRPQTLAIPNNFQVTFPSETKAILTWNYINSFQTGFVIYFSSDTLNYDSIATAKSNDRSIEISKNFTRGILYYFKIKSISRVNTSFLSSFINGYAFIPDVPVLRSPLDRVNDQNIPIVLNWYSSIGAMSYELQVSTTNQFADLVYFNIYYNRLYDTIKNLKFSTNYYWRVRASNNTGISLWSAINSFKIREWLCEEKLGYFNQFYKTVKIGNQCWFAENLNVGEMINGKQNQLNNGIIEKYCYNNDTTNCIKYGGLYQWDEAMQNVTKEKSQGICPDGWHIPTLTELIILQTTVNNSRDALLARGQLTGQDTYGFSALLAGIRNFNNESFNDLGYYTYFSSSTENDSSSTTYLYLTSYGNYIYIHSRFKTYGYSVRCLKDDL